MRKPGERMEEAPMAGKAVIGHDDDGPAVGPPPAARSLLRRWAPAAVLFAGFVSFFALDLGRFLSFETLAGQCRALDDWVDGHPVLARGGYALIYAVAVAFSLPVGVALTVGGGILFGLVEGTALTVLAATAGAYAVFMAARSAFGDTLRRRAGPFIARLEDGFRQDALSYLLVLRLVPLFPFWLVNIVPALLGVPARTYVFGTLVGMIPGTIVFVSIGNGLDTIIDRERAPGLEVFLEPTVFAPLAGLTALALVPVVYKRLRDRGLRR